MKKQTDILVIGGVYYTQDAHLVPERFVLGLARHAEQNGAVIHTNTEVIGMKKSGRRITSVLTTRGDFTAKRYIYGARNRKIGCRLAAGERSDINLSALNIERFG